MYFKLHFEDTRSAYRSFEVAFFTVLYGTLTGKKFRFKKTEVLIY
jgi:hypothetical protein